MNLYGNNLENFKRDMYNILTKESERIKQAATIENLLILQEKVNELEKKLNLLLSKNEVNKND